MQLFICLCVAAEPQSCVFMRQSSVYEKNCGTADKKAYTLIQLGSKLYLEILIQIQWGFTEMNFFALSGSLLSQKNIRVVSKCIHMHAFFCCGFAARIQIERKRIMIQPKNCHRGGSNRRPLGARMVYGHAMGVYPKKKIFKSYIDLETQLGEVNNARTIYGKWIEFSPDVCDSWVRCVAPSFRSIFGSWLKISLKIFNWCRREFCWCFFSKNRKFKILFDLWHLTKIYFSYLKFHRFFTDFSSKFHWNLSASRTTNATSERWTELALFSNMQSHNLNWTCQNFYGRHISTLKSIKKSLAASETSLENCWNVPSTSRWHFW